MGQGWGPGGEAIMAGLPGKHYDQPVHELAYSDLLFSTICKEDQDREKSTWAKDLPSCVFCGHSYRFNHFTVECHMDPTITKETTGGRERQTRACKPTINRCVRYQEVLEEIRSRRRAAKSPAQKRTRDEMEGDGGADDPILLDSATQAAGVGSSTGTPFSKAKRCVTEEEVVEAWSEAIIKNGLSIWMMVSERRFEIAQCFEACVFFWCIICSVTALLMCYE